MRRFRPWAFAVLGAGAFLLLQLHFSLAWRGYYARFPFRGYERAMAQGNIPPFFTTSPRSLLVARIVLLLLPLASLWFRNGRRRHALLALWLGIILALFLVWVGTSRLREDSNMWPIDLVFLLFTTGTPLLLGGLCQAGLEAAMAFLLKQPPETGERAA